MNEEKPEPIKTYLELKDEVGFFRQQIDLLFEDNKRFEAENASLRAERDKAHNKGYQDAMDKLEPEYNKLQQENETLKDRIMEAENLLHVLNNLGGLGFEKHNWIRDFLGLK